VGVVQCLWELNQGNELHKETKIILFSFPLTFSCCQKIRAIICHKLHKHYSKFFLPQDMLEFQVWVCTILSKNVIEDPHTQCLRVLGWKWCLDFLIWVLMVYWCWITLMFFHKKNLTNLCGECGCNTWMVESYIVSISYIKSLSNKGFHVSMFRCDKNYGTSR